MKSDFKSAKMKLKPKGMVKYTHKVTISVNLNTFYEKREEIWLSPMTKAPTSTEKSNEHRDNIQKRHQ